MMTYCFIKVLQLRKKFEMKRQQYEVLLSLLSLLYHYHYHHHWIIIIIIIIIIIMKDHTTNILLERAFVTLDNLLEDDEG